MSLRRRLALLSGAAVAVAIVLASAIVYVLVRDSLRDQVDDDLRGQAERPMPVATASRPGPVRARRCPERRRVAPVPRRRPARAEPPGADGA